MSESPHSDPRPAPHPGDRFAGPDWWRSAVVYQVYPSSFSDGDGDGIGDLRGLTARLHYLADLGVDALWISPFMPSPRADAGYDIADYCDVDPLFGSLADFDALIASAHALGLRVIIDLVPNHTSDEHPWFRRALAAGPGSPEREWYHFRPVDPDDPDRPPNDWPSEFGGSAWSREPGGEWYLHLFDAKQSDLNWSEPRVRAAFLDVLRFWLDRGVDGFRVDVAHGLVKAEGLPDLGLTREELAAPDLPSHAAPFWDQDGVHEIYRDWRRLLDAAPGHRAATTLMLALPGSAYLYQGEELGLPEVLDLPASARRDPMFARTRGARLGRDGCRVPLPWHREAPGFDFGRGAAPWLPQPDDFGPLAVDQQDCVPGSTLELYRSLLAVRSAHGLGEGSLAFVEPREIGVDRADLVVCDVRGSTRVVRVFVNLGAPLPLPADAEILVASDPSVGRMLPTDCAVWLDASAARPGDG